MNLRNVVGLTPEAIAHLEDIGVFSVEDLAVLDPDEVARHVPSLTSEAARLFKIRAAGLLGGAGATATREELSGAAPSAERRIDARAAKSEKPETPSSRRRA